MNLIFDMYGVIIKESKGNFIPYVYSHFPNTVKSELVGYFNQANSGKITGNQFAKALGFEDANAVTKDYVENHLTFDNDFLDFAEKYKSIFTFALLSNDVLSWSLYITAHYDIDKYFCHKTISGEAGYRKPDRKIYETLLEKTGWNAKDCIFIDNSAKNLVVAADLGMKTILFNRDNEEFDGDIVYSFEELDLLIERKYINGHTNRSI